MEFHSVWRGEKREYPRLKGDIERDVLVIGGGIAGFLTAFRLHEAGCQVTLIEADRLFSGTTEKTTAKITANQGTVYADLYERYGLKAASLYYRAQKEGMEGFASLVKKYNIDCDWTETDGYIFSAGNAYRLKSSYRVLRKLGADCEWTDAPLPFRNAFALKMGGQYLFDPLRFLTALPVGFEIYEHTRASDVDFETGTVRTENGEIRAKKLVIATHFPIVNSRGLFFMKLRQSSSCTVAVEERLTKDAYLEAKEDGLSARPYADGTLFGGEDYRTGRKSDGRRFERLEERVNSLFGKTTVARRWCAEDVMTPDGIPMSGFYAKNLPNAYVITGFNKWGMTNAMACAGVLRDLILKRENPYVGLFSPQRRIKRAFGWFLSNTATNVKGLFLGYCKLPLKTVRSLPVGEGATVWYKGKIRAVYRDYNGTVYAIEKRCPHMKCALEWNREAKTWDCPCHGSRFDIYGNILSGPAVKKSRPEE